MALTQYYGTGRRKTATARVYLRPGSGSITVNHREFNQFFPTEALRTQIQQAFVVTEMTGRYDVLATVSVSEATTEGSPHATETVTVPETPVGTVALKL